MLFHGSTGMPVADARDDGYYMVDGPHRVSVAPALGRRDIDAWVTPVGPVSCSESAEAA